MRPECQVELAHSVHRTDNGCDRSAVLRLVKMIGS
jgi:hypothetical protein